MLKILLDPHGYASSENNGFANIKNRIIAIMLGRLRMSLDECQRAYTALSETIFTKEHHRANPVSLYKFLQADGKFQKGPL